VLTSFVVASLLTFQGGITVPAYAASKGGVGQLTKALSNEWAAKGINVNAIAPGYIATDMNEVCLLSLSLSIPFTSEIHVQCIWTDLAQALIADEKRAESILSRIPAGRWGSPEDFKGVVVWLSSGASAYVSGEIVTVDGGWMGR
jgi:2-deoxy-D-gluconate 3-dehydrogenase